MVDADSVAQEAGMFRASVSDKGFGCAQVKMEFVFQEVTEDGFDFFRFRFRPGVRQDKIVGVAQIAQSSEIGVVRILGW